MARNASLDEDRDKILHQLGSRYLQFIQVHAYTDNDIEGMEILLKCYERERIRWHISHRGRTEYTPINLTKRGNFFLGPSPLDGRLNDSLILLVHLPGPEWSDEKRIKFRLAQWYYMHKDSRPRSLWPFIWTDLIRRGTDHQSLQKEMVKDSLIALKGSDTTNVQLRVDGFTGLVSIGWKAFGLVSSVFLTMNHPILYKIHSKAWINWRCIEELKKQVDIHEVLEAMLQAQEKNEALEPLWRCEVTEEDVEEALSTVSPPRKSWVRSLVDEELRRFHLLDAFHTFDKLIEEGCSPGQHEVMINLICQDLEAAPLSAFERLHRQQTDRAIADGLQDPTLRLLMCSFLGITWEMDWPVIHGDDVLWQSWVRANKYCCGTFPSINTGCIGRIRMQLWDALDPLVRGELLQNSLGDIRALTLLRTQFTQPTLGVEHGGDYLMVRLSRIGSRWGGDYSLKARLPSCREIQDVRLTICLLLRRQGDPLPRPTFTSIQTSTECLEHLRRICDDIKRYPSRLMDLLSKIYSRPLPESTEFVAMVLILERHLIPRLFSISFAQCYRFACMLSKGIDEDRYQLTWWDRGEEEEWMQRLTIIIRKLMEPRISRTTDKLITCRRPLLVEDVGDIRANKLGLYA